MTTAEGLMWSALCMPSLKLVELRERERGASLLCYKSEIHRSQLRMKVQVLTYHFFNKYLLASCFNLNIVALAGLLELTVWAPGLSDYSGYILEHWKLR